MFAFWKIFKKTKMVDPAEADIWTGKAAIDAQVWPSPEARTFMGKVSKTIRIWSGYVNRMSLIFALGLGMDRVTTSSLLLKSLACHGWQRILSRPIFLAFQTSTAFSSSSSKPRLA